MEKKIEKIIADFKAVTGYSLSVKDGNPYYGGSLDLRGTGITSLPDNLTEGEYK